MVTLTDRRTLLLHGFYGAIGAASGGGTTACAPAVITPTYAEDLGIRQGMLANGARNTALFNAALSAGRHVRLRAGGLYRIGSSLTLGSGAGLTAEGSGSRSVLYMPADAFDWADVGPRGRYGTRAVGIDLSGGADRGGAPTRDVRLAGFTLQSEVRRGRALRGIVARNAQDIECSDVEIFGLPTSVAFCLSGVRGDSLLDSCYVHDCTDDFDWTTRTSGKPNITAFEIDNDLVGGIATEGLRIVSPRVRDVTVSGAYLAKLESQTDALNICNRASRGIRVSGFHFANVGEGIDCFGHDNVFTDGLIEDCHIFGTKCVHGGSRNRFEKLRILRSGLAGITLQNAGDRDPIADNVFRDIVIDGVGGAGRYRANDTAGVLIAGSGLGTGGPRGNRFDHVAIDLRGTGKFGWLDTSTGRDNEGHDVTITGVGRDATAVHVSGGASRIRMAATGP